MVGIDTWEALRDTLGKLVADSRVDWDDVLRESNASIDRVIEAFRQPSYARQKMALKNSRRPAGGGGPRGERSGGRGLDPRGGFVAPGGHAAPHQVALPSQRLWQRGKHRPVAGQPPAIGRVGLRPGRIPQRPWPLSSQPQGPEPGLYRRDPQGSLYRRGSPLSHSGAGYLLYSVGPNGRDDGGKNTADDGDKWLHETDPSKIPDYDDIAIRTPEETP